jgi:adenosylcobinamide-GDP ribazoletransferase
MKDSQIGTYGVIALIGTLGLKWIALSALLSTGNWGLALLGAAVASRAAMVCVMYVLPNARPSGLSQQTGKPPLPAVATAAGIGFIALLFGLASLAAVGVVLVVVITTAWIAIAKAKIGGQTGDVLGATQQIVEITILLVCLASLS